MLAFTAESIESCGAGEARDTHRPGALAQLVERLLCKQDVRSSNLLASTLVVEAGRLLAERLGLIRVCSSVG